MWCKPDAANRWYPVDEFGERWITPKASSFDINKRPTEIPYDIWRTLKTNERRQFWKEKEAEEENKSAAAAPGSPLLCDSIFEYRTNLKEEPAAAAGFDDNGTFLRTTEIPNFRVLRSRCRVGKDC